MDVDVTGKSVIDIGCWEGHRCLRLADKGAKSILGIDICESPNRADFDFLQIDVMSDRFWEVEPVDIVFCTGVLYHIPDPINFLYRLRRITKETLVIGTVIDNMPDPEPIMKFLRYDALDRNPSNWWLPNSACFEEMLKTVGFEIYSKKMFHKNFRTSRMICYCNKLESETSDKILPRKRVLMNRDR